MAMMYYAYEIYLYAANWYSLGEIQDDTHCDQIFPLEIWLVSQNVIWLVSLGFLMTVLLFPVTYKLLLCFLYLLGPVYLTWTIVAVGYYSAFLACCTSKEDKCTEYYPYYSPAGFVSLILISLMFSSLITVYLVSIIVQALWAYFRHRFSQYIELLM